MDGSYDPLPAPVRSRCRRQRACRQAIQGLFRWRNESSKPLAQWSRRAQEDLVMASEGAGVAGDHEVHGSGAPTLPIL